MSLILLKLTSIINATANVTLTEREWEKDESEQ
jgi:hypothetical protein